MADLPEEVRKRFTSDMGFVVDYLNDGHFENRKNQKIVHIKALCGMMMTLTNDERFMQQIGEFIKQQQEGKEIIMCKYIDMLEARDEARGEEKGRAAEIVEISHEFGQTEEYILDRLQNKLNISLKKAQEYLCQFGAKTVQKPLA